MVGQAVSSFFVILIGAILCPVLFGFLWFGLTLLTRRLWEKIWRSKRTPPPLLRLGEWLYAHEVAGGAHLRFFHIGFAFFVMALIGFIIYLVL